MSEKVRKSISPECILRSFQELPFAPLALLVGEASPEGIQLEEHVVYVLGRKLLFVGLLLACPRFGHFDSLRSILALQASAPFGASQRFSIAHAQALADC